MLHDLKFDINLFVLTYLVYNSGYSIQNAYKENNYVCPTWDLIFFLHLFCHLEGEHLLILFRNLTW